VAGYVPTFSGDCNSADGVFLAPTTFPTTLNCTITNTAVPLCGNASINTGETCDDGNTVSWDGCSTTCAIETGWQCDEDFLYTLPGGKYWPVEALDFTLNGAITVPNSCGGYFTNGCPTANTVSLADLPDGYSIVAPYIVRVPGSVNPTPLITHWSSTDFVTAYGTTMNPVSITTTVSTCVLLCGNTLIDTGETCDDGNTISGDGCSNICQREGGGGGWSICGNMIIESGESCDDGNMVSWDGCSNICIKEGGGGIITPPTVTTPPIIPVLNSAPPERTSPESVLCTPYLSEDINLDKDNTPSEVVKLEEFLNTHEGESLEVNGVYERVDYEAVKRFQQKYLKDIILPWGAKRPTGMVANYTRGKINVLVCAEKNGCPYFNLYHKKGEEGWQISLIQNFLNLLLGTKIPENGIFDTQTFEAVKSYQTTYRNTVLQPWGLKKATGWWYQSTRVAANNMVNCSEGKVRLDNGNIIE
jgi:cysteine-rich repeat protein